MSLCTTLHLQGHLITPLTPKANSCWSRYTYAHTQTHILAATTITWLYQPNIMHHNPLLVKCCQQAPSIWLLTPNSIQCHPPLYNLWDSLSIPYPVTSYNIPFYLFLTVQHQLLGILQTHFQKIDTILSIKPIF